MANTGRRQPALETHSHQLLFASAQRFQRNVLARRRDWGVLLLNKHVMIMRISFNLLQEKKNNSSNLVRLAGKLHFEKQRAVRTLPSVPEHLHAECDAFGWTPLALWAPMFPLVIPPE